MRKFNVGDKVRVVEKPDLKHYRDVWWDPQRMAGLAGTAGVVQDMDYTGFCWVEFPDYTWTIHQDDLELIEAARVHEAANTEFELRAVSTDRIALYRVEPVQGVPRHQWKAEWVADFHQLSLTRGSVSGQVGGCGMKVKTRDLTGVQLDYAVAVAEGWSDFDWDDGECPAFHAAPDGVADYRSLDYYTPSTNWEQGGPIIERHHIGIAAPSLMREQWRAMIDSVSKHAWVTEDGPTPLIAAMRCFVASKLGDEVEIPEELK